MDTSEYREHGKDMVDYIAEYLDTIRKRRVFPSVSPGYMKDLIPSEAPQHGEEWSDIISDVERVIMPGMTHWQSPYMHAYFPATHSYPALLGDMLADGINALGFTWASSPACTELEVIVMDWLAKLIGLPSSFMHNSSQPSGGGAIQTTASEATFVCMLAARTEAIRRLRRQPELKNYSDAMLTSKLVAYCSEQAHSSVEKASLISLVQLRLLPTDDEFRLRGDALEEAIERDRKQGLVPFFVCATLGTTGCCSFDNLEELGVVCKEENIWLHVDAAYAGSAFICPEYQQFLSGIEYAQSFVFNPSKWLLVNFDCTAMWVTNSGALHCTFNVEPLYLQHENSGDAIDYMHWQVPLSRRFRALKLWFVMRSYGVEGLQAHIRKSVGLGEYFEKLVRQDGRFELPAPRHLGLIVLRLKGINTRTERLLKNINREGRIHMVPASLKGNYVIRFTVTSTRTTCADLNRDWNIIQDAATKLILDENSSAVLPALTSARPGRRHIKRRYTWSHEDRDWDMSLLLSNVPVHPHIVNGTFAALCDIRDKNGKACSSENLYLVNVPKQSDFTPTLGGRKFDNEAVTLASKKNTCRVLSLDTGIQLVNNRVEMRLPFDTVLSESSTNDSSPLPSDSSDEERDSDERNSNKREDQIEEVSPVTNEKPLEITVSDDFDGNQKRGIVESANLMFEKLTTGVLRKINLVCEKNNPTGPAPASEKQERNGHWGVEG